MNIPGSRRSFLKTAGLLAAGASLTGCLLLVAAPLHAAAPPEIRFEDVSARAGMVHASMSWGASWGDFNGDGFLDLFITNGPGPALFADDGPHQLLRNLVADRITIRWPSGVEQTLTDVAADRTLQITESPPTP
jgi:hypothetical protein